MQIYISVMLTDKSLPGSRILTLSPAVRPAHHHSVVLHAPQTTGLDQMDNALPHFRCHHNLAEAFNSFNLHHILNSLKEDTIVQTLTLYCKKNLIK